MGRGVSKIGDRHLAFVQSIQTIAEHVRERKEKKQRVARKIGELKRSVSELAMSAVSSSGKVDKFSEENFVEMFESMLPRNAEILDEVFGMIDEGESGLGIETLTRIHYIVRGSMEN